MKIPQKLIEELNTNPIEFSLSNEEIVLSNILNKANDLYYNSNSELITDSVYDTLLDIFKQRFPNNNLLKTIGAPINSNEKVKLKYHMGSMDKIKEKKQIKNFIERNGYNEYIITDKLDGISGLLLYNNGKIYLYSRGDGTYGKDISYLVPYIKTIPKLYDDNIEVRGELIVSKENFKKYSSIYSYPRSIVNSIVNSKSINSEILKCIDFVSFELITPSLTPLDQFKFLKNKNFIIPSITKSHAKEILLYNNLIDSYLYNTLKNHYNKSLYDIDGIIITNNILNKKNIGGNPKYSFAFKVNKDGVITKINNIVYNTSKYGKLIPTIMFEPIKLGNSIVKNTTGFSAKYIVDNKLNVGSTIKMVLSGDIIPYIVEIVENSEIGYLPEVPYYWDDSNIHIFLSNPNDDIDFKAKRIEKFMKTIGINNISIGIIKKLIKSNYDTIDKILNMSINNFQSIDGFKETLSKKLYNNIHSIIDNPIDLDILMNSSMVFGNNFGSARFKYIIKKYSKIDEIIKLDIEDIKNIPGFSEITATQFIENLPKFIIFLERHPYLKIKSIEKIVNETSIIKNTDKLLLNVLFTGIRDENCNKFIINNGGNISSSINSNTSLIIIKNIDYKNKKVEKALEKNIPILTIDEFKNKYSIV